MLTCRKSVKFWSRKVCNILFNHRPFPVVTVQIKVKQLLPWCLILFLQNNNVYYCLMVREGCAISRNRGQTNFRFLHCGEVIFACDMNTRLTVLQCQNSDGDVAMIYLNFYVLAECRKLPYQLFIFNYRCVSTYIFNCRCELSSYF